MAKIPSKNIRLSFRLNRRAMTLIEILLVVSLVSLVSIAIYNSLSSGIKVWNKSREVVVEEDIAVFFEKIAADLRNTYFYSKITPQGSEYKFSFPAFVNTVISSIGSGEEEYTTQLGKVEYYFDPIDDAIYRRQANYGQALEERYCEPQLMVKNVKNLKFSYYYLTDKGESYSSEVYEALPSSVEIEVTFMERQDEKSFKKIINIPVNI